MALNLGSTTLPIAGWFADPRQPQQSRDARLAAIRRLIEEHHLATVELTMDLAFVFPGVFDAGFYAAVAGLQQELGFACTAHLPFLWADLASLNEPVRQASVETMIRAADLVHPIQVDAFVLHLWGMATRSVAGELDDPGQRDALVGILAQRAGQSLAEVGRRIAPERLCVENLEDPLFSHVAPYLGQHGAGICLDVGHLAWSNESVLDFLERYGTQIHEVHLHDSMVASAEHGTPFRDHLALGHGRFDYVTFLARLETTGFEGAVILEVNSEADLGDSLHRLRTVAVSGRP